MNDLKLIPLASLQPRRDACTQGDANPEHSLGIVPLHGLSVVDVKGKDARVFLQSKLTTNLLKLDARGAAYGYATDINGRVIFDAHIAAIGAEHFRLWTEPSQAQTIVQALDKYIIMEDVALEIQPPTEHWMLVGDEEELLDAALGLSTDPLHGYSVHSGVGVLVMPRSARPARLIEGASDDLRDKLVAQGAAYIPWDMWRGFEIQEGFVRTGFDLVYEQTIPLEAGADLGVDYNKGCYLGQEVIERLRSRGTPNREYRRITIDGDVGQVPFDLVNAEGKDAGLVTSVVKWPEETYGIAVIRRRVLQSPDEPLYAESPSGARVQIIGKVR